MELSPTDIEIRTAEATGQASPDLEKTLFGEEFLIRRPLLEAILSEDPRPPVLLIDELDRADEEFEAFLLEILSDFQVSIPEIGTLKARRRPWVVITSNRTRDIHDALKRRCLYHWIEYPSLEKEYQIILSRIPKIDQELAVQLARFMTRLRREDLTKKPGISETLDWAQALIHLHRSALDESTVEETLGCILKYRGGSAFFSGADPGGVLPERSLVRWPVLLLFRSGLNLPTGRTREIFRRDGSRHRCPGSAGG